MKKLNLKQIATSVCLFVSATLIMSCGTSKQAAHYSLNKIDKNYTCAHLENGATSKIKNEEAVTLTPANTATIIESSASINKNNAEVATAKIYSKKSVTKNHVAKQSINVLKNVASVVRVNKSNTASYQESVSKEQSLIKAFAAKPGKGVLILLAFLIPILAIYLHQGEVNKKFWIGLVLSLLFWVPAIVYALIVVTKK